MNKIELLPKDIYFENKLYQVSMWVTAFGRLCLGYREAFKKEGARTRESICSVCVEPENEPRKIEDTIGCYLNEGVGNAKSLDDACEELLDYIEKNKEDFEIK